MDRIIKKKKWTPKRITSIILIAAFLFFIVYLIFLRDKSSKLYVEKDQLTIVSVLKDKFQEFIPIDGVVAPKGLIQIDAVQGGVVEQIFVEDGANLKKNDTLVKLMNAATELSYMEQETRMLAEINNLSTTQLTLDQSKFIRQKDIIQLQYQIDIAKKNFDRMSGLYKDSVISLKEYEDSKRDFEFSLKQIELSLELKRLDSITSAKQSMAISNSLKRMQENLELLRKNMQNAYVRSPGNGKLSGFHLEIGETRAAGSNLGQIDLQTGFELQANIDERYIARVDYGQGAEFELNGVKYELYIEKIYTDVTSGSFRVDLYFKDDNHPETIKRGQTIPLRLKFDSETDAIIIKRGGFYQETGGNWIYILDETESFATKRNISLNRQNTNYYEVVEGLQPGEKVIVSSYESFGDKDKLIFR